MLGPPSSLPAAAHLPLHDPQLDILEDPARFKVLAAGRRWGKTTLFRGALLDSAVTRPGKPETSENWHVYLAPDQKEARRIMWRPMLAAVKRDLIEKTPNETRMEITLVTGAIIALLGADDPDSLRGIGIKRLVGDEWADMPGIEELWEPVILPSLLTSEGDAFIGGTPKGFNHFYEMHQRGTNGVPGWRSWQYPTRSAPHIRPEAYAALVAEYTDARIMRQELEASFEAASGTILGDLWAAKHVVQANDRLLIKMGWKPGDLMPWHVVDLPDWTPPAGSKVYGSVDYGFGAPCALYLHATLPDGHVRTFWELYQRGIHDHEQAARLRVAIEGLRNRTDEKKRPIPLEMEWTVLEPIMYASRREMGVAKTIAEVYADALIEATQLLQGASGRSVRISRPQRWRSALMTLPDGLPAWSCTTACPHLIRTVPKVPWDQDDPEVEDDTSENHAYESIGRFFEARPLNPKPKAKDPYEKLDPISAEHQRALDKKINQDGGDTPSLYVPM